jgi:hypothetical protein
MSLAQTGIDPNKAKERRKRTDYERDSVSAPTENG